tara:strand:+ start:915 stop:2048 length:1134 start_codon:yes stop_codon:yes gene_type:complete
VKKKPYDNIVMHTIKNKSEFHNKKFINGLTHIIEEATKGITDAINKNFKLKNNFNIKIISGGRGKKAQTISSVKSGVSGNSVTNLKTVGEALGLGVVFKVPMTLAKITIQRVQGTVNQFLVFISGDLANKPWNELQPELKKTIATYGKIFDYIKKDKELLQIVRKLFEDVTNVAIDTMQVVKPTLTRSTRLVGKQIADIIGTGITTGMSVIWSVATRAIGSIPVVGALLAIPIVVLNTLNRKVIPAGTRIASRGLEQTALAVNAVNQTRKVIGNRVSSANESINKFGEKYNNIKKNINSISSAPESLLSSGMNAQTQRLKKIQDTLKDDTSRTTGKLAPHIRDQYKRQSDRLTKKLSKSIPSVGGKKSKRKLNRRKR